MKYYDELQKEFMNDKDSNWNQEYEEVNDDEQLKPIRNIFKMSRVLVTQDEKKKQQRKKNKNKAKE